MLRAGPFASAGNCAGGDELSCSVQRGGQLGGVPADLGHQESALHGGHDLIGQPPNVRAQLTADSSAGDVGGDRGVEPLVQGGRTPAPSECGGGPVGQAVAVAGDDGGQQVFAIREVVVELASSDAGGFLHRAEAAGRHPGVPDQQGLDRSGRAIRRHLHPQGRHAHRQARHPDLLLTRGLHAGLAPAGRRLPQPLPTLHRVVTVLANSLVDRMAAGADPVEVSIFTGALTGAILAARQAGGPGLEVVNRAIGYLESGFPLARPRPAGDRVAW
jgi:hypothetical protein